MSFFEVLLPECVDWDIRQHLCITLSQTYRCDNLVTPRFQRLILTPDSRISIISEIGLKCGALATEERANEPIASWATSIAVKK